MYKYLLLLLYLVMAPVSDLSALDIQTRGITMAEGLKSNTVRTLAQDRFGFIWMGTDFGLCRYDGISVKPYLIKGLSDQYVPEVIAFGDDMVVGTSHGVYRLNLCTEKFAKLAARSRDGAEMNSQVTSIKTDRDSNLWISTVGQGVFCYSHYNEKLTHYPVKGIGRYATKIYIDNEDQVWLLTNSPALQVMRFDKSRNDFVRVTFKSEVADYGALTMIQLRDGSRWLGTWNHGMMRMNEDGSLSRRPAMGLVAMSGMPTTVTHIHALYEQAPDRLLVGCDDGLMVFNPQTGSYSPFAATMSKWGASVGNGVGTMMPSPAPHFVYSIMQDREGGLWYSTFYGGVVYVSPVGARFRAFTSQGTGGMVGNVISRFCEDTAGNVWIASDDGGVICYSPKQNAFVDLPRRQQLKSLNAHAFCMVGDDLWIGTYSKGIFKINTKSHALTHIDGSPQSVYAMYRDRQQHVWIGTIEGLVLYDPVKQTYNKLHDFQAIVIDIDEDQHGNIWICTQGNGLWRYSRAQRRWQQYKIGDGANALPDMQVNSVCVDVGGRVIVATASGVCVYQPRSNDFAMLLSDSVSREVSSVVDDQGVLWMSTNQGILRYSGSEGIQLFNRYDGLVSEQFQPNAGMKTSDGCIYFGSPQGFCSFYPYRIKVNRQAPSVYITRLEIFNQTVETGSRKLPRSLLSADELELNHNDAMFSLHFAALSYCSPEKNQYAYKLEGFDKEWNYVGSAAKATYTNIPAGTYTFRVKATNNDGVWSRQEATLKIVVHPPFWWSLPAQLAYLLLIAAGIWCYIQMRLRKAERRHQREMQRLNDRKDVEVKEARLRFFTMIAHEIRTPVTLIIGPLENLIKDIFNSPKSDVLMSHHESLQMINRNAHRLLELVNQLLDFNKIQEAEPTHHFRECRIAEIMTSVAERFEPTLKQKGADFRVEYPPEDFTAIVDRESLTKIISNLMTNATKYTRDEVVLSCKVVDEGTRFVLEVRDNGMGISKADQQKIFHPFYQAQDNKPGTGIGLTIVDSLVNMHNGHIAVESQLGKGSVFRVTLPVTQSEAVVSEPDVAEKRSESDHPTEPLAVTPNGDGALLIIEDDDDMLRFLVGNFKSDYTVITARNGREGLEQVGRNVVSLIISDWMMPEMDGAEFCRRLRADRRYSHIPLVLLTAKTDDDSKTEGMNCGADAYIEKPFSVQYLKACIKNMLDIRHNLFLKYSASPNAPITEVTSSELDNELLLRMTQIIEENIDSSELNVNFLADRLSISRSGLFAKIKAIADVTPNELIQIVRLKRAAHLLTERKYRINEVSYMVGFSSPSYFSKCFQRQFGVKPGEYADSHAITS